MPGAIRFGLNAVKSVGRNLVERIVEERKEKPYASLYDFCKRLYGNEMNRRAVESLVKAGAFDSMGENRHSLVEAVDGIIKSVESDSRRNLDGQLDLFSLMSGEHRARRRMYMRSGTSKNTPIPNCCSRKKRSAACTCPATRWMRTGSSRQSLRPIPSRP